jgi:hypothetical protein
MWVIVTKDVPFPKIRRSLSFSYWVLFKHEDDVLIHRSVLFLEILPQDGNRVPFFGTPFQIAIRATECAQKIRRSTPCSIWRSDSHGYEESRPMGYNPIDSGESQPTFRSNLSPLFSGLKSKWRKKPAWSRQQAKLLRRLTSTDFQRTTLHCIS